MLLLTSPYAFFYNIKYNWFFDLNFFTKNLENLKKDN